VQLTNRFTVPVPTDQVWGALLDAPRIAPCMPGATIESVEGHDVHGNVKVKLGPIAMRYQGTVSYLQRDDTRHRAVMAARAKETRGAGTADATIAVELVDHDGSTSVEVRTDLQVTGKPAQFGRGVIEDVSGHIFDQFARNLAAQMSGPGTQAASTTPTEAEPGGDASPAELDAWPVLLSVLRRRAVPAAAATVVLAGVVGWGLLRRRRKHC
jgi:carbon monoxide dehydrogenase subunit G